jgi:hypothetical protein
MINYFNTQNSLTNFKFEFDPDRFVPSTTDLNQALKANIGLFSQTKFNDGTYKNLFGFADEANINNLNDLVDFITSQKFNNLINPVD